jgi:hypothetical protein
MVCSIEPSLGEVIYTEEAGRGRRLLTRPRVLAVHKTRAQRRVVVPRNICTKGTFGFLYCLPHVLPIATTSTQR